MNCLQHVETIRWPWMQILGSSSRVRRPPAHPPRGLSQFHKLLEFQSALASKTLILLTSRLRYWAQKPMRFAICKLGSVSCKQNVVPLPVPFTYESPSTACFSSCQLLSQCFTHCIER